jgi:hypothetical protein
MSGNLDTRTEQIPATGVVNLGNANFLFVISATGAVSFKLKRQGLARGANQENYTGITAGLQVARTQRWDFCDVTGTPGVTVTFIYGYTDIREDVTLFNQQIAVISGVTAVATQPSATITDTAPISPTVAGQHALVPQNLARRRVTIFSDPANVGDTAIFLRKAGGANNLGFIVPGTYEEFDTTAGLDYQCTNGGDKLYIFEES